MSVVDASPNVPDVGSPSQEPPEPRSATEKIRGPVSLVGALAVGAAVLRALWLERYEPLVAVVCLLAYALLYWSWPKLRAHPRVAAGVAIQLVLAFLYLWSLDERMHVQIRVTPGGYVASIGSNTVVVHRRGQAGIVGLYAGTMSDMRVETTGEQDLRVPNPLLLLGDFFRTLGPEPGWSSVRATSAPGGVTRVDPNSGWSRNRRGELEGAGGTWSPLFTVRKPSYTISADLMRSDGVLGLVLANPAGRGYVFTVRMDAHSPVDPGDAAKPQNGQMWRWSNGAIVGTPVAFLSARNVDLLPMLQRDVRILVTSVWIAWLLVLLVLGAAALLERWRRNRSLPENAESRPTVRRPGIWALLLIAFAFEMTALIGAAVIVLPHIPDSVAYLFQAKTLALGRLSAPVPKFPAFFSAAFILDYHGHWFGKYPPGWPLFLAVGVRLGASWLVNPVLSGGVVALMFVTVRRLYGNPVALLATALLATSPLFLFLGGSFMAHTSTLFCLMAFAAIYVHVLPGLRDDGALSRRRGAYLVAAGFFLGLAFLIRQLDVIPFAIPLLALLLGRPLRPRIAALVCMGLGTIPSAATLLIYNYRLTGRALTSPYTLWWSFDRPGFGTNTGVETFTPAHGFWNMSFNLQALQSSLFGWPWYIGLAVAALPFLFLRARRMDIVFGAMVAGVVLIYVAYYGPGVAFEPRYYFVGFPGLAVLAARGVQELCRLPIRAGLLTNAPRAARVAPLALLGGLFVYNLTAYLPTQFPIYASYGGITPAPVNAVKAKHIHNALVFVQPQKVMWYERFDWSSYLKVFSSNDPMLQGDVVYARDRGAADRSLAALYPGRAYYRMTIGEHSVKLRRIALSAGGR